MVILGIDPGLGRTGWGIVEEEHGKVKVLGFGCIETEPNSREDLRLQSISKEIKVILDKFQPQVLAIEKLFFNKNVKTALSVGQARGVVLLEAVQNGVIVEEYTPLQVKIAVTGYGRADKNQVGAMIKSVFGLDSIPKPDDVSDALAVALTHAASYKIRNLA